MVVEVMLLEFGRVKTMKPETFFLSLKNMSYSRLSKFIPTFFTTKSLDYYL